MAGPGLPAPASAPAAYGGGTGIDVTYADNVSDPSVQAHQKHHDLLHWIANGIDKDSIPTSPVMLGGRIANNQTGTSYTLALTDVGKVIECNNASPFTLTVPTNAAVAFPIGALVYVYQQGAGAVTITAATPATTTLRTPDSSYTVGAQYGTLVLRKRATDEWVLEKGGGGGGTVPGPPPQVTGLTAGTPTQTTQPLSWNAATGATSYLVEYKAHTSGVWLTSSTTSGSSATVSGLTAGTSYDYQVTAEAVATPSSTLTNSTASAVVAQTLVDARNTHHTSTVTDAGGTYQVSCVARNAVSNISAVWANWYTAAYPTGDTNGLNSYTINNAYVVTGAGSPKTLTRITFGGSNSTTISAGATATGTATISLTAGQAFWIRCNITPAAAGSYPLLDLTPDWANENYLLGSDVTANTSSDFASFLTAWGNITGPIYVVGTPAGTHSSIHAIGDNITRGEGDDWNSPTARGFIVRALNGQRAFGVYAQDDESLTQWNSSTAALRRALVGVNVDYLIMQHGLRDMYNGRTLAQVQADLITACNTAHSNNASLKIFGTTLTPWTTSTDGWATTGNQTTNSTVNPTRVNYNNWLRDGAPYNISTGLAVATGTPTGGNVVRAGTAGNPLQGYFEIADIAESARNSGIWKASSTSNGSDPNATMHQSMAAGIVLSSMPAV